MLKGEYLCRDCHNRHFLTKSANKIDYGLKSNNSPKIAMKLTILPMSNLHKAIEHGRFIR